MAFTKITASGIGSTETVTLDSLSVINDVSIGGTLTYEDVTNIDSVGLITARAGVNVGSGITLSKDGDIFATGVTTSTTFVGNLTGAATQVTVADESSDTSCNVLYTTAASGNLAPKSGTNLTFNSSSGALTATSFVGSGANLTGVASTENIRTNTNATFLQNINVSGTSTVAGTSTANLFSGSGASLTNLPAAQLTGTLPALDGSSLTGVGKTVAEGGNESTYESGGKNYMIHTFLTTGVFRTNKAMTIDFLLVGGGGGSAAAEQNYGASGGGGGGGVVEGSGFSLSAGTYVVTVGAGGAASNATTVGGTGGDTTFASVTAKGGGGGADYGSTGGSGGSGGGGSEVNQGPGGEIQSSQNAGISNIQQFGSDGGQGGEYTADPTGGGGGGGAGGNGARPTSTDHGNSVGGAAGAGRANSISGSSTLYGRGGIGGGSGYLNAEPGLNGRGDGATGATSTVSNEGAGAVGGTGIVIIKYEI